MGFSVVTALDGLKGIELIKHENLNLIVCDIKMPNGVSGMDVLKAMHKYNPDVHFVATSGHLSSDKDVQKIMENGATMFVKKPFPSLKEVTEKIARLVA